MSPALARQRVAGILVALTLGFFALLAQALLFRAFLREFEGHEFAVGCFFGSWLLWLGPGALLARRVPIARIGIWLLAYLPAFLLQQHMILHARAWAGVRPYEFFPLARVLVASVAVNAPTSILTGFLFAAACAWAGRTHTLPLARVYAWESLGGFLGGAAVTLALVWGARPETIFLAAACALVALVVVIEGWTGSRWTRVGAALALVALALATVLRADLHLARSGDALAWTRLLPGGDFAGSFSTPQGQYLYGRYRGQFEVTTGHAIVETVPDPEHAAEVVALHLARIPAARTVLVVGPGSYSACRLLLALPQMVRVVWLDPDPHYPAELLRVLPPGLREPSARFEAPADEVRSYLRRTADSFDLIVVNLPDATSLALNRYFTSDFFALARARLTPSGVLSVRVSGGENYLGGDLAQLGASAYAGLCGLFPYVALKPGDESWLMGCTAPLTDDPAVLTQQFAGVPGHEAVYPSEGIGVLYPPDRIRFQLSLYQRTLARVSDRLLRNTDRQPRAMLLALLLAVQQSGGGPAWSRAIKSFALGGRLMVGAGAVLAFALWWLYRVRGRGESARTGGGWMLLVFTTGFAGMAMSVILMFLFQVRFGSLALHAGLLAALFMLGLYAGSSVARRWIEAGVLRWQTWLALCLVLQSALLADMAFVNETAGWGVFIALFAAAGFVTGGHVPVAARLMKRGAGDSGAEYSAAFLLLDNGGGAAGGFLGALLLVPALATPGALFTVGLLLAFNVFLLLPRREGRTDEGDLFDRTIHRAGYIGFGAVALALVAAQIMHVYPAEKRSPPLLRAAQAMAGAEVRLEPLETSGSQEPDSYTVRDARSGAIAGYVFSTERLVPGIRGYGGRLVLALMVEPDGRLRDVRVISSSETPAYLDRVRSWMKSLAGRDTFTGDFADVDGVAGATITSEAIVRTLRQAGPAFRVSVLHRGGPLPGAIPPGAPADFRAFIVLALIGVALVGRARPQRWARRVLLIGMVGIGGLYLNAQYSLDQIFSLFALRVPMPGFTVPFVMIVVVPLLVLFVGNIYCGHLCPFGALQELLGDLRGSGFAGDPDKRIWRCTRAVKYVLLAALAFWLTVDSDRARAAADPLVTVFSRSALHAPSRYVLLLLAASLLFRRFWCRNLCPAGAFLSLVGGRPLLRRWMPAPQPARCDLGVRQARDLDCLHCDRCRMAVGPQRPARRAWTAVWTRAFVAVVLLGGVGLGYRAARVGIDLAAGAHVASAGPRTARPANVRALRALMERHELSEHEARYYQPYVPPDEGAGDR